MADKKSEVPTNPSKSLTDSDTSDDNDINPNKTQNFSRGKTI